MRIFVAGATGVIGRRLVPLLRAEGHEVTGLARSAAADAVLRGLGAEVAAADVFDAPALLAVMIAARPEVVVHQLTALPDLLDPDHMAEALGANARIRSEGTRHLVAAARAAGARRLVAQSIAWAYAEGPLPHTEDHPLEDSAPGLRGVTLEGVRTLERQVLEASALEGVVLRYGTFYGSDTYHAVAAGMATVHVDAAARAAVLAVACGGPGIYNVTDDGGSAANAKARVFLGWDPAFRLPREERP